jgi:CPA2 family monovalent cation:H+ antiporter-2
VESESSLLLDVAVAFGVALAGGFLATRLRLPAIVGYIAAGLIISPFTPGFVGDAERLRLIADIGVVLLLFAVGVQFTIADLLRGGVRVIALAVLLVVVVMAVAQAGGAVLGWSWRESAYIGAAASIASSVVPVTLLERRGELASEHGRLAVGVSIVQDLIAVVLIIGLDAATTSGGGQEALGDVSLAVAKAGAFIAGVLIIGIRVVPFVLNRVAEERSRELFFLAVAALVIGTALASDYVGLSLALGAFLAGIVVSESDLSHRVIGELLPVRDVFAVLFFVTAGMLVQPSALGHEWEALFVVLGIIVAIKPLVLAAGLVATRVTWPVAVFAGAFMIPNAEFAFLLASAGVDQGVLTDDLFSAIIAACVLSIVLTPIVVTVTEGLLTAARPALQADISSPASPPSRIGRRAVLAGYNEVGEVVAAILQPRFEVVVLEEESRRARLARERGIEVVEGSPTSPAILGRAGIEDARVVVIALEDPFATRLFAERARERNPYVDIVAHAHIPSEAEKLRRSGIAEAVVAENEVAFELARHGLHRFGLSARESLAIIQQYRARLRLSE